MCKPNIWLWIRWVLNNSLFIFKTINLMIDLVCRVLTVTEAREKYAFVKVNSIKDPLGATL